jgi:hypothetical protein
MSAAGDTGRYRCANCVLSDLRTRYAHPWWGTLAPNSTHKPSAERENPSFELSCSSDGSYSNKTSSVTGKGFDFVQRRADLFGRGEIISVRIQPSATPPSRNVTAVGRSY